jgi:hypothetical protein
MSMGLRETLQVCAFGLTVACSSEPTVLLPPVDHDAEGSWGYDTHGALNPGNSFVVALTESNGTITGGGSFAGEAGPYGSLTVTGTVNQDSVNLRIVYIAEPTVFPKLRPDTALFAGVLTNKNQIVGSRTRGGLTLPFGLVRLTIGDRP